MVTEYNIAEIVKDTTFVPSSIMSGTVFLSDKLGDIDDIIKNEDKESFIVIKDPEKQQDKTWKYTLILVNTQIKPATEEFLTKGKLFETFIV